MISGTITLEFKPFEEICIEFLLEHNRPNKNLYERILQCIPSIWKELLLTKNYDKTCTEKRYYILGLDLSSKIFHVKFTTKVIYGLMLNSVTPKCVDKWSSILNTDKIEVKHIFHYLYKNINDNYMLDLNWKYLHLGLPTKDLLFKCGITDNNTCMFCNEIETNLHLFVDCFVAFNLYMKIQYLFQALLGKNGNVLNLYHVCLGFGNLWKQLPDTNIILCNYLLIVPVFPLAAQE